MTPPPAANTRPPRPLKPGIVFIPVGLVLLLGVVVPSAQRLQKFFTPKKEANPYFKPYSNPYPQTQNGFRFVAVFPANLNREIKEPYWPFSPETKDHWEDYGNQSRSQPTVVIQLPGQTVNASQYAVVAHASNGDTLTQDGGGGSYQSPDGTLYRIVHLPWPGVPGSYKWIDLTLVDKKQKNLPKARWRISDLARLDHAILPTNPQHSAEIAQGVPVQARAWWDAKAAPPIFKTPLSDGSMALPVVFEVKADVPQSAYSRPFQSWMLQIDSITQEWEAPAALYKENNKFYNNGDITASRFATGERAANDGTSSRTWYTTRVAVAPTPACQHIARIKARLTQIETQTETVTFRNLSLVPDGKGWRIADGVPPLVTPSGIRVSLLPLSPEEKDKTGNALWVHAKISVSSQNGPRLNSSLQKNVGAACPIKVTWDVRNNQTVSASRNGQPDDATSTLTLFKGKPFTGSERPSLTVTVTQEAQLHDIPLTFTVPIKAGTPTEKWAKEKGTR